MSNSVLILGSCVSRDAFGPHNAAQFPISAYIARTSWGSAFAERRFAGVALERIASPFQRRMVELDTGKGTGALLAQTNADLIVVDLIDERFDLFTNAEGAICTVSPELLASGFEVDPSAGSLIRSGSERFFALWEQGWVHLHSLLRQNALLGRVRINRLFLSDSHEDGQPFANGHTAARIDAANRFLERLYRRLEQDLPEQQFIRFPQAVLKGALCHRWGSSPFHYIESMYAYMVSALLSNPTMTASATPVPAAASIPDAIGGGSLSSPNVVFRLDGTALADQMQWHELRLPQGANLQIDCLINADGAVSDRRALLGLECRKADGTLMVPAGFATSARPDMGSFRYLGTGQGSVASTIRVTLPVGFSTVRVGVRNWMPESSLLLRELRVTFLPQAARREKSATILSVDVEALPGRAEKDSVERLIFGRFGDGKAVGIERLCDMFERVGARATFFVDYSTCDIHGESGIFAASELLKARGHDVQLHMHSEVLVRQRRWPQGHSGMPAFDVLDVDVAQACLEYGIDRFQRNLGHRPRIFRPGGMKHSKKMVSAVKRAGIPAVSSLYRGHATERFQRAFDQPLMRWDNGILEAPLDFGLDPLLASSVNRRAMSNLLESRRGRPLTSVLIHSTSLLFRALDNSPVHFTGHSQGYEDRLQEYLDWFAQTGDFITYSDLLDSSTEVPTLSLDDCYTGEEFEPDQTLDRAKLDYTSIAIQKSEPRYDLTITLPPPDPVPEDCMALVPAPQLPLRLAPGQRLAALTVQDADGDCRLAYVLSGHKAYLMRQRCVLPGGTVMQQAIETMFARHPRLTHVLAQSVLEDAPITGYAAREDGRRTYVLDLPDEFETYRLGAISKKHRSDIERKQRTVVEILPGLHFRSLAGADLHEAAFLQAAQLIESRLKHKVEGQAGDHHLFSAQDAMRQWDIYRRAGEVVQLWNGKEVYAAALCLHVDEDCFFMASGHQEAAPKHSLGNILLYRLIESLIARGVRRLHLGGGDFDYKTRYGAVERQLRHYEFTRSAEPTLPERVLTALAAGESVGTLEQDLAAPLETILHERFETAACVEFNMVVENDVLGTDGQARRYQATSRDAFLMMMKHVPFDATEAFVDIGCGKGKMLYYASQLGYRRCVGIEIAELLLYQARANFERLRLPAEIVLKQRDASKMPMADLYDASLFYLYNPFSEGIMRGFLRCLLKSQQENPRLLRVVYCNALFEAPFAELGFHVAKVFVDGEDGWRFGHAVIYERYPT